MGDNDRIQIVSWNGSFTAIPYIYRPFAIECYISKSVKGKNQILKSHC